MNRFLTILLLGVTLAAAAGESRPIPLPALDDRALTRRLETEGLKLFRSGRVGTNLQAQLNRTNCRLRLPVFTPHRVEPAELYRLASASVVILAEYYLCSTCAEIHMGAASGFLLTEDGALVTCRHVVSRTNTLGLVAMTRDGRLWPVREVLAASRASDLAILQLEGAGFTPLPLVTNVAVGAPVTALSHPDGHYYLLTGGMIARYSEEKRRRGTTTWMTITAPFAKGSSGAPVFDASGGVAGIVNNTESIYYDQGAKQQRDLQMVLHNCTPTAELLKLIRAP